MRSSYTYALLLCASCTIVIPDHQPYAVQISYDQQPLQLTYAALAKECPESLQWANQWMAQIEASRTVSGDGFADPCLDVHLSVGSGCQRELTWVGMEMIRYMDGLCKPVCRLCFDVTTEAPPAFTAYEKLGFEFMAPPARADSTCVYAQ